MGEGDRCRRASVAPPAVPRLSCVPPRSARRHEMAGERDPGQHGHEHAHARPARSAVDPHAEPGPAAAPQVRAGHVGRVEPAAGIGAQGVHPGLVGEHAGLHRDVEQQRAGHQRRRTRRPTAGARGEDRGRQQHPEQAAEVHPVRSHAVHQPPRVRGAQHGHRAHQGEHPHRMGAQAVHRAGEQQRQAGPDGREAAEDRRLVEAGAAQFRLGAQQAQRRGQQGRVRLPRGRGGDRQGAGQDGREQQGHGPGRQVRGPPPQPFAQRPAEGAGQQHATGRTAQQGAQYGSPAVGGHQAGRQRTDDLRGHGGHPDDGRRGDQRGQPRRAARDQQTDAGEGEQGDEERAVRQPVAERHQQEDPRRVADLDRAHHEGGGAGRLVQGRADQGADGLREVDGTHADGAGQGEEQQQSAAHRGRPVNGPRRQGTCHGESTARPPPRQSM